MRVFSKFLQENQTTSDIPLLPRDLMSGRNEMKTYLSSIDPNYSRPNKVPMN
jgi:hypothetical protein